MLEQPKVQDFFHFCNERHLIYVKRFIRKEPYPWTDDPILQEYKFTNIYRELDTGTIWCREKIRDPYSTHPELFFNIASYRLYNWIGTQAVLGFITDYNAQHYMDLAYQMRERGEKIFTGAHMLPGVRGMDKIQSIFGTYLVNLWENRRSTDPEYGDTLEAAFHRLMKMPGFGPFLAYEVISDLRWTRYLYNATDINTWANPGPGAQRGIIRLHGVSPRVKGYKKDPRVSSLRYGDYVRRMQELLYVSGLYLREWMPIMEMRDIEHSLCEWDKYERVRNGEGHPRARYSAPAPVPQQLSLFSQV